METLLHEGNIFPRSLLSKFPAFIEYLLCMWQGNGRKWFLLSKRKSLEKETDIKQINNFKLC